MPGKPSRGSLASEPKDHHEVFPNLFRVRLVGKWVLTEVCPTIPDEVCICAAASRQFSRSMEKSSSLALASPASKSNHRNGATSSPNPEELIVDCGLVMLNTSSGFACSHGGSGTLVLAVRSGMLLGAGAEGGTVCDSE